MGNRRHRITSDTEMCGGRPCIRNMRIEVSDVLELFAAGDTRETIFADYHLFEGDDIIAAPEYAA
jgi:uncharacterized protein (DUF433 family)